MVTCSACGKRIEEEGRLSSIMSKDLVYHLGCAPEGLVRDAMTEWDAIVTKGIKYFVSKYLPPEGRPSTLLNADTPRNESTSYSRLFTEFGDVLRKEIERRKI